jgi:hypothetical protein
MTIMKKLLCSPIFVLTARLRAASCCWRIYARRNRVVHSEHGNTSEESRKIDIAAAATT